ncbi:GAF and ANTAR domain-containing protein [Phycicoccus sp. 3266]|uniref:GAF domain-containing protein n=1 Tax=Phycicoccus sp. 3266 TaxID=2817751 RepID=UPI002859A7EA|nr:GAF and ANTAR domain-containing protein [Phycicoccus sp. 3266]MDR6864659.1 GAF domain-containing protein [Phycicoccus sp. 3266]
MPKALDETWRLLDDFADAARTMACLKDTTEVAEALCQLTLRVIGGDHVSITSLRHGRATTVAATSDVPEQADKIQYSTGQGPCLEAIREHTTFRVDDLQTDPRWPVFGEQAVAELGMRSMLAHVLPLDDQVFGALNVYSTIPGTFTSEHETLIAILGTTAAHAVSAARHHEQVEHLERALHTSRHIGVALGILVNSRKTSLDEAWELLAKASQDRNVKVSALAEHVIQTGSLDAPWGD